MSDRLPDVPSCDFGFGTITNAVGDRLSEGGEDRVDILPVLKERGFSS